MSDETLSAMEECIREVEKQAADQQAHDKKRYGRTADELTKEFDGWWRREYEEHAQMYVERKRLLAMPFKALLVQIIFELRSARDASYSAARTIDQIDYDRNGRRVRR